MMEQLYPTTHNSAAPADFAKTVLMPGDPLRAQKIAKEYLTDAKLVNNVRGVQGYTGTFHGKRVSVMASGMGMPSMGIYSYELFRIYGVENIIRIGSAGRSGRTFTSVTWFSAWARQPTPPMRPISVFPARSHRSAATACCPGASVWQNRQASATTSAICCPRMSFTVTIRPQTPGGQKWAFLRWKWKRRRCI